MTDRNPDVNCDGCGRYLYSVRAGDSLPPPELCEKCKRDGPPADRNARRPGPITSERPTARNLTEQVSRAQNDLFDILDGGWIERYHIKGQRMLTRQSVAEHSWRMAAIVFAINPHPRTQLILATLFHDVSERVTGDMPANVKRACPELAEALNTISTEEEERLRIRFLLEPEEQRLLAWVDRFEGALHCWDELEMGNRKVLKTLLRYMHYCEDKKYVLSETAQEAVRQKLFHDLRRQVVVFTPGE